MEGKEGFDIAEYIINYSCQKGGKLSLFCSQYIVTFPIFQNTAKTQAGFTGTYSNKINIQTAICQIQKLRLFPFCFIVAVYMLFILHFPISFRYTWKPSGKRATALYHDHPAHQFTGAASGCPRWAEKAGSITNWKTTAANGPCSPTARTGEQQNSNIWKCFPPTHTQKKILLFLKSTPNQKGSGIYYLQTRDK